MAIAIPIFTSQLEKSREATDLANLRSAYGEAVANALGSSGGTGTSATYKMQQSNTSDWNVDDASLTAPLKNSTSYATWKTNANGTEYVVTVTTNATSGEQTVTIGAPTTTP